MEIIIRAIQQEDAKYINEIRKTQKVMENILSVPSERISFTREYIDNLTNNDHVFIAQVNEGSIQKIIGIAGLHVNSSPRLRHSAGIGICIHKDYHNMGIGKKLMKEILNMADNWLMLVRVELSVYCDNKKAINLYTSLGFEIEGTKKYASIREGIYADEYIMARYNNPLIP